MAGPWTRWVRRHVNALSFWGVLIVVAALLVLLASLLLPPERPPVP